MRVLFHAINGVGLGHLARAAALALAARALGHEVLVLTSALDPSLLRRYALDHVRLPPRLREPHASPTRSLQALDDALEQAAVDAVLDAFVPDLVVLDTHPPAWFVRLARRRGARVALVLRELRPEHLVAQLHGDLMPLFDRVLVPHDEDEVDAAAWPWCLPVAHLGPVLRPLDSPPLGLPHGRPLLVAVAGGGGQPLDAARYLRAAADAHTLLRVEWPSLETVLVCGPYGQPPARTSPGVRVLGDVENLDAWLREADLVVSQAGYNAVAELRALAAPAVLVPGRRRAESQHARARRMVRRGLARLARPEASDLADVISSLLRSPDALAALRRAHLAHPAPPRTVEAVRWLLGEPRLPASPALRIVLVAPFYPPRLGGMESAAHQLARALAARGHEVIVYTHHRLGIPHEPGVTVRKISTEQPAPTPVDLWGDLLRVVAALGRDTPHVVHLCDAALAPWIPWLRAVVDGPVTVNVHGNDLAAGWTQHGLDEATRRTLVSRGLSAASAVIAVSEFSRRLARAAGAPDGEVILGGVELEEFAPSERPCSSIRRWGREPLTPRPPLPGERGGKRRDSEALHSPLPRERGGGEGLSDAPWTDRRTSPFEPTEARPDRGPAEASAPRLLTVSRLAPRKGHATVIRALPALLRRWPGLRYAFTGEHPGRLAALRALAEQLGVASALEPLGQLEAPALLREYQRASVFVMVPDDDPEDVEGFGLVLLEAAACGLPVVTSRSGGAPEAAACVGGEVVPASDPKKLASLLARWLADPVALRERGEEARRLAARCSWARTAEGYERLFRRALSTPRDARWPASLPPLPTDPSLPERSGQALAWLREAEDSPSLREAARAFCLDEERSREARRARYRASVAAGKGLKLRATGAGRHELPRALEDCAAVGVRPAVELRLEMLLEPLFWREALPRLDRVFVLHALPSADPVGLLRRLEALPRRVLARLASVSLVLREPGENEDDPALVAERDALHDFFARRAIPVTLPVVPWAT